MTPPFASTSKPADNIAQGKDCWSILIQNQEHVSKSEHGKVGPCASPKKAIADACPRPRAGAQIIAQQAQQQRRGGLYTDSTDALKAVKADFEYWTGKLTDSSFELSLAVVAANWAAFGSVDKILNNLWAKSSLGLLIVSLSISLYGAKWMGELHCKRLKYASDDPDRWDTECATALHAQNDPWPFTRSIEHLGRCLRGVKTWCPLLARALFLVAQFST